MKVERYFENTDRYAFDVKLCTKEEGYAQIDTTQDAWYFGTWTNPDTLTTISYTEGDVVIKVSETESEYVQDLLNLKKWNATNSYDCMIDPGFSPELKDKFIALGLNHLIY